MTQPAPEPTESAASSPPRADVPALAMPSRTTPTWEMELLISAASAFALFQLGGQIDAGFAWLEPRLGIRWKTFLAMMNVYATGAVVMLAATFAIHLLLRARWIALVGMNSVFPGGIRWNRIRGGPIQVEVARRRALHMDAIIERADNFATIVFALGVALALSIVLPALTVALVFAASIGISSAIGMPGLFFELFAAGFGMLLAPYFVCASIDTLFGKRLDAAGGLGRLVARVLDAYSRIGFGRSANTLLTLLGSNVGERKALILVMAVMGVVFAIAGAGPIMRTRDVPLAEWDWLPGSRSGSAVDVQAPHYADHRKVGDSVLWPYLPSMVSRGPWLPLVVPYDPVRHNESISAACPTLVAEESRDPAQELARRSALLACIAKIHPASLDGQPLILDFQIYQAADGLRGFIAMIDVRSLAPGRHVLALGRPTIARDLERGTPPEPFRIPFWR
jgi:hypothetical protein